MTNDTNHGLGTGLIKILIVAILFVAFDFLSLSTVYTFARLFVWLLPCYAIEKIVTSK